MIHSVFCLWEFREGGWWFVESFATDRDGACLTPDNRDPAERFMWEPDEDGDADVIPGRMVTVWTFEGGVRLRALNAPKETWAWTSPGFGEALAKKANWFDFLAGGLDIWTKTFEEGRRLL